MTLPRRFGRYLLVEKLATGGMAEIYEARLIGVEGFEKPLAIKQILPHWSEKTNFVAMLIDEAKIAVRLNHPNIVQVYELGNENSHYYIAMELVEGVDLRELQKACRLSGTPLPLPLVLFVMQEVAQALAYAHELTDESGRSIDIIHRDISPQNILVSYEGQVKVTDFGIAKAADRQQETVTGTFKGKFSYMSPEQANQLSLDQRSDLFSLGIVFYELATGQRLFAADSDVGILDKVREAKLPEDQSALLALPEEVRKLIVSLLAQVPAERPSSAAEVRDRLRELIQLLQLSCDRQELAGFLSDALQERIQARKSNRARLAKQVKKFESPVSEQETRTVPPVLPRKDSTRVIVGDWKQDHPSPWRARVKRQWPALLISALLVVVVLSLVALWPSADTPSKQGLLPKAESPPRRTPPEVEETLPTVGEPEVKGDQAISARPEPLVTPKPVKSESEALSYGRLSVQAVPWGYVYAGSSGRRETPLTGLKLAVGRQRITVKYPPTGDQLQRTVDIRPGKSVTCIARFGPNKGMSCR